MVLEQVDLVDIQEPAIGARKQPRLERLYPGAECPLEIERADDAVLGRAKRQIDEGNRDRRLAIGERRTLGMEPGKGGRHWGKQGGERAHRGRLAGAAIAEYHHAADPRVDRGQQQCQFHLVLADDRRKGKCHAHRSCVPRA